MSILIHGMEMPKDGECIVVSSHGTARKYDPGDVLMYGDAYNEMADAIELPPHGRLIDADEFLVRNAYFADREFVNPMYDDTLKDLIDRADTIIPADPDGGADG